MQGLLPSVHTIWDARLGSSPSLVGVGWLASSGVCTVLEFNLQKAGARLRGGGQ